MPGSGVGCAQQGSQEVGCLTQAHCWLAGWLQVAMAGLVLALLRGPEDYSDSGPLPRMALHWALLLAPILLLLGLAAAEVVRLVLLLAEGVAAWMTPPGGGAHHQQQQGMRRQGMRRQQGQ